MSAFSFGFSSDDVDEGDESSMPAESAKRRETEYLSLPQILPAQVHSLEELLSCLPSSLSYNLLDIPGINAHSGRADSPAMKIPRRALFDVRAQLMAEADSKTNKNDELIRGLDQGDLTSGLYEGGFKTWECAVDLAARLSQNPLPENEDWHTVELGAGSAIPSLVLFQSALRAGRGASKSHFTFCDYNAEVLRLVTAPNVLLAWWEEQKLQGHVADEEGKELELEIDGNVKQRFLHECERRAITFSFVSGGWDMALVELVAGGRHVDNILILASETIYSPGSLSPFAQTVYELLDRSRGKGKALIAAKQIYFGVGGGVQEFVPLMDRTGCLVQQREVVRDGGVGRVILEVILPTESRPERH